jgi:hypothetical protein
MSQAYIVKGNCDIFMGDIELGSQSFEYELQADDSSQAEMCITDMLRDEGARNIKFETTEAR